MTGTKVSKTDEKALISGIILEAMMAGLLESCQTIHVSELGARILQPFMEILDPEVNEATCGVLFVGRQELTQDDFILGFMRAVQKSAPPFAHLAATLDEEKWVSLTKQIVRYLGIRFATLFCILGVIFKESAKHKGLLVQDGHALVLSAAQ